MKVSLIIPVYYNEDNLRPLYSELKKEFIDRIDYEYEIILVNDGSKDKSYEVMKELASQDTNIKIFSLSRNFGSHSACLCGLVHSTGDCAIVKSADNQEPTELIHRMVESWRDGNNVVLACREGREESKRQIIFANLYYWFTRKTALPNMPKNGFDVYLLDRKVVDVLENLDEKNSAITGQILWSGFRTGIVYYTRKAREIGKSTWTLRKKIQLVSDTLFSFSTLPIRLLELVGCFSFIVAIIWSVIVFGAKLSGVISVSGYTTLLIFNLFSFGVIMISMGVLGEYLWRTFDSSRNRPPYIIEDDNQQME